MTYPHFWSDNQESHLRDLHAQGKSTTDIASALDVSYSAVFSKLEMIGLRPHRSVRFRPISDIAPDTRDRVVVLAKLGHSQQVIAEQCGLKKYDVQRIAAKAGVVWKLGHRSAKARP